MSEATSVRVPYLLQQLAMSSLKQYALVLDAMRTQSTSDANRRTFTKEARGVIDLVRMLEDCKP